MKKLILSLACIALAGTMAAQDNPKDAKKADKKTTNAPAPEAENRSISEKALPNKTGSGSSKQQTTDAKKGDAKTEEKSNEKKPE